MSLLKLIKSTIYFIYKKYYPLRYAELLGVSIGKDCRLIGNINYGSEPYLITIGSHVSITASTFITHDGGVWVFRESEPSIDIIAPITIGNNVFIGQGCIIMPGVTIGDNVIIGAGSIVTKSLPSNCVCVGTPAKAIKSISEYFDSVKVKSISTKHLNSKDKRNYLMAKYRLDQT